MITSMRYVSINCTYSCNLSVLYLNMSKKVHWPFPSQPPPQPPIKPLTPTLGMAPAAHKIWTIYTSTQSIFAISLQQPHYAKKRGINKLFRHFLPFDSQPIVWMALCGAGQQPSWKYQQWMTSECKKETKETKQHERQLSQFSNRCSSWQECSVDICLQPQNSNIRG